ncbi:hypothetical protein LJK88_02810 [Paenibacillus sp. P26]|nr:hypothetical protein LJK88_02810 [Paenibacillus sp. P26]
MNMTLAGSIVISAALLLSLPLSRRLLHPLEILSNYMTASLVSQMVLNIFIYNLGVSKATPGLANFWTLQLSRLISVPVLFVWLFWIYRTGAALWLKALATALWIAALVGSDQLVRRLGLIQDERWSVGYSALRWVGLWLFLLICCLFYRKTIRKEAAA